MILSENRFPLLGIMHQGTIWKSMPCGFHLMSESCLF